MEGGVQWCSVTDEVVSKMETQEVPPEHKGHFFSFFNFLHCEVTEHWHRLPWESLGTLPSSLWTAEILQYYKGIDSCWSSGGVSPMQSIHMFKQAVRIHRDDLHFP